MRKTRIFMMCIWLKPTGSANCATLISARTPITDDGLRCLRFWPELRVLRLSKDVITNRGLAYLKDVPRLETLDLRGTCITNEGLAELGTLAQLQSLDLSQTRIGDGGLVHLQALTQLAHLRLAGTRITDRGLAFLSRLDRLVELDVGDTAITWKGLAALSSLPALRTLSLSGARTGDVGPLLLQGFPTLAYIDVSHTGMADAQVADLRSQRARLQVANEEHASVVTKRHTYRAVEPEWFYCQPSHKGNAHGLQDVHWLAFREGARVTSSDLSWIGQLTQFAVFVSAKDSCSARICRYSRR